MYRFDGRFDKKYVKVTDRQTDRQTDAMPWYRPQLCIASHGKNYFIRGPNS